MGTILAATYWRSTTKAEWQLMIRFRLLQLVVLFLSAFDRLL